MQASLERLRQRREETGDEAGFTLIELLIVIVILGILAAIVVFAVQNLASSSAKASCGSDQETVETAAEAFKAQIGSYPNATLPAAWALDGTAVAPPTGYPAAGTGAMTELLSQYKDTAGDVVGPWLKDAPYNPSHYSIVVTNDGFATISVYNGAGNVTNSGCTGVS